MNPVGLGWMVWTGVLCALTVAAIMGMPNRRLYASIPRWLIRVIRVSAVVFGISAAANFILAYHLGVVELTIGCIVVLSAIVMAVGVIAARWMGADGI